MFVCGYVCAWVQVPKEARAMSDPKAAVTVIMKHPEWVKTESSPSVVETLNC